MWQPPPPERQSQTGWFPLSDAALIGVAPAQADVAEYADPPPPHVLPSDADTQRWPPDAYAARLPYNEMAIAPSYTAWPPPPADHFESSHRVGVYPQSTGPYEPPPHPDYHHPPHSHHHDYQIDHRQEDEEEEQYQETHQPLPPPLPLPPRRRSREPAIGRWVADEHKLFLKGLEMFQGPAWGEIARLIGTRTSTQVRTHAQKFFTKLARAGQSLPYFAAQIQRERSRLLSQATTSDLGPGVAEGDTSSSGSSVTPTSTSTFSFALSNLSPHKRVTGGSPLAPVVPNSSKPDGTEADSGEFAMDQSTPSSHDTVGSSPYSGGGYAHAPDHELFKPKFGTDALSSPLLRKPPRLFLDSGGGTTGYHSAALGPMPAITLPPPAPTTTAGTTVFGDALSPPSDAFSSVEYTPRQDSLDVPRLHFLGAAVEAEQHAQQQQQQPFSYGFSQILNQQPNQQPHQNHHQHHYQQQYQFPHQHFVATATTPSSTVVAASPALATDPWGGDGVSPRQWLSTTQLDGASPVDAESLPSMNKLLFRTGGSSV